MYPLAPRQALFHAAVILCTMLGQQLALAEEEGVKKISVGKRSYLSTGPVSSTLYNWDFKFGNPEGANEIDLLFCYQDSNNYYRFRWQGDSFALSRHLGGKECVLARCSLAHAASRPEGEISIRRRPAAIYVVLDGKLVAEARDSSLAGGCLAVSSEDSRLQILASRVQPVEAIHFSDDFMRQEEEQDLGQWSVATGEWSFRSVMSEVRQNKEANIRKGKEPEAQRSANPFTFQSHGGGNALAVTGYLFWDDYEFSASMKSHGGECGVAFNYRSPDDYFLFCIDIASRRLAPSKAKLVKVTREGREILAERYLLAGAQQWYRLQVSLTSQRIQAFMDRVAVFDLFDPRAAGGMIGLFASSPENTFFDDVQVQPSKTFGLERIEALEKIAAAGSGRWEIKQNPPKARGIPTDPATLESLDPALGLYLCGHPGPEPYVWSSDIRAVNGAGKAGLLFGHRDRQNYWLVRVQVTKEGAALYELVQVQDGKAQTLKAVPAPPFSGQWSRWALDLTEAPCLKFCKDGDLALRFSLPETPRGSIGLYTEGAAGFQFRSALLEAESKRDWERLEDNKIFSNDPYMQGWASPRWAWIPLSLENSPPPAYYETTKPRAEMEYPTLPVEMPHKPDEPKKTAKVLEQEEETRRLEYVHKGDFFGSFAIQLPLSDGILLAFGDEDPTDTQGYSLAISSVKEEMAGQSPRPAAQAPSKAAQKSPSAQDLDPADAVDETIRGEQEPPKPAQPPRPTQPKEKAYDLKLKRHGEEVAQARIRLALGQDKNAIRLCREGHYLWITHDRQEVAEYRDPAPLQGRRVRLVTMHPSDLASVDVRRDHVKDYLFKEAPTDWIKVGQWEITNRFACDPRWSHLNGESKSDAVLWHKDEFLGDVTLEFYAGMRMRQGRMKQESIMYYPRVGDLNAAISATGKDLATGYSFILGAWDPLWSETWTRILRREQVASETDQQLLPRTRIAMDTTRLVRVGWDPGGRAIHGAWYYIKIRRRGNEIKYYFDNHLALSYNDNSPLTGSRLGIWTYNNSIMVARVKISYDKTQPASEVLDPLPASGLAASDSFQTAPLIQVTSPSHPGVFFDFDHDLQGWSVPQQDDNTLLSLDSQQRASGQGSLMLTNTLPGGDFGVRIPLPELNLADVEQVAFDYRIPPEAKINLYFSIRDDPRHHPWCFIPLTGETRSDEKIKSIQGAPRIEADGQWHHFSFPLGDALRELYPGQSRLLLATAMFGNLHEGYLHVGIGGNGPGVSYHLDNFQIASRGSHRIRLNWKSQPNLQPKAFSVSLERNAEVLPDYSKPLAVSGPEIELKAGGRGLWFATLSAQIEPNSWTPAIRIPVFVEPETAAVVSLSPEDKGEWGGEPIRLTLAEHVPIATARVQLELDGKPVPSTVTSGCIATNRADRTLTLDLQDSGLVFKDGQAIAFSLLLPTIHASSSHQWSYRYRTANDHGPPSAVRLLDQPARFDFERPHSSFEYFSEDAVAVVDAATSASGSASLKLFNMVAGCPFTVLFPIPEFHANRFSLLSLDYRVPRVVRSNFILEVGGEGRTVVFTDRNTESSEVETEDPPVIADGEWHHLELNLRKLLAGSTTSADPDALKVTSVKMQDQGYHGNALGATIHLDNLELIPCVSSRQGFTLRWEARDPSGIRGYSYCWSLKQPAAPEPKILLEASEVQLSDAPEGDAYFNIRAVDAAGNWGQAAHYRFLVDNQPPAILATKPEPGASSASRSVHVVIADDFSGILATTMKVTANGKPYTFDEANTRLHEESRELEWEWAIARGPVTGPVPDGSTMTFKVENLADTVGNSAPPIEWSWQIQHEQDRTPPLAPSVKSPSHAVHTALSFSENAQSCSPFKDSAKLYRTYDPSRADYCLLVGQRTFANYGAIVVTQPFDVTKFPILALEYRAAKHSKISLWAQIHDQWHPLTGGPDFIADGEWHLTWCDLEAIFKAQFPEAKDATIQELAVVDYYYPSYSYYYDSSYSAFWLDAVSLVSRTKDPQPVIELGTYDETGVSTYSIVLDQNYDRLADAADMAQKLGQDLEEDFEENKAAVKENSNKVDFGFERFQTTIPDEQGEGLFARKKFPPVPRAGLWFLHVRACDGAGNWGATAHYPFFCTQAGDAEEMDDAMPDE